MRYRVSWSLWEYMGQMIALKIVEDQAALRSIHEYFAILYKIHQRGKVSVSLSLGQFSVGI